MGPAQVEYVEYYSGDRNRGSYKLDTRVMISRAEPLMAGSGNVDWFFVESVEGACLESHRVHLQLIEGQLSEYEKRASAVSGLEYCRTPLFKALCISQDLVALLEALVGA